MNGKSKPCRVRITDSMTEVELRREVNKSPDNGSYADTICRNCGAFRFSLDGDPLTAKLTDQCEFCPRDEDYKLLVGREKFEKLGIST